MAHLVIVVSDQLPYISKFNILILINILQQMYHVWEDFMEVKSENQLQ